MSSTEFTLSYVMEKPAVNILITDTGVVPPSPALNRTKQLIIFECLGIASAQCQNTLQCKPLSN